MDNGKHVNFDKTRLCTNVQAEVKKRTHTHTGVRPLAWWIV